MKAIEELRRKARLLLLSAFVPLVPGFFMWAIAIFYSANQSGFVKWCIAYWWLAIAIGGVIYLVASITIQFFIRCPYCNFRLSRAGLSAMVITSPISGVRHCPHCGASLTQDKSRVRT
jgi:hypothetical protein